MRHLQLLPVIVLAACASKPPSRASGSEVSSSAKAPSGPAEPACANGAFVEKVEDDGHGVTVTLTVSAADGSSEDKEFYVHDKGNPTRGLNPGDPVWLVRNPPGSGWDWILVSAEEAGKRCPAP